MPVEPMRHIQIFPTWNKELAVVHKACGRDVTPFWGKFYQCEACQAIVHPSQVTQIERDRVIT